MKTKSLGIAIAAGFALCAMFLGNLFPIIGSSVFALILGILLNELTDLPENARLGLNWSGKKLLQYSIIFMGFSLPIATVASTGLSSQVPFTDPHWLWYSHLRGISHCCCSSNH